VSNRMKGHSLKAEGGPHDATGKPLPSYWGGTSGLGFGACSCGALSRLLDSGNLRKRWHREHKEELRKESKS